MLTKEQYLQNVNRAKDAFTRAGLDTSYTLGQAVEYFLKKTGFANAAGRMFFHEAMHVTANALSGNGTAEAQALAYEQVLCRGKLGNHNPNDHELFGTPDPVPTWSTASLNTKFFSHFLNSAYPSKLEALSGNVDTASYSAYSEAIDRDGFFSRLTGGRALYQLTTNEACELPVVFLGVVPSEDVLRMSFPAMSSEMQKHVVSLLDTADCQNPTAEAQIPITRLQDAATQEQKPVRQQMLNRPARSFSP